MHRIAKIAAVPVLTLALSGWPALAQDHHEDRPQDHHEDRPQDHHEHQAYVRHDEWRKGAHIRHEDWARGERIDYRAYHLRRPPSGYEWREVDGNYVLAAVATGIISSVVVASTMH